MDGAATPDISRQLAHAKILPLLVRLTIPITVAQLVNALYSIVDRMYIGHMPGSGTLALSGIGLTFPVIMVIAAFSCLPGMGGAPMAAIAMGAGDRPKAQRYLNNALTMLLIISTILTIGCMLILDPMLLAFGASEATLPYARQYLGIYLTGTVFIEIAMGLNPFINTQGYTGIGTLTIVIGALLNIVLDPIFIYGLDLGISGAAIATVISQMVSAIWVVRFLCSKKSLLRLDLQDMKPDREVIRSTFALGISPFTFRINESIVVIILNRLLLYYGGAAGELHVASMAILSSIGQIFFMPLIGVISGAQPILSYNMGAKNFLRLQDTVKYARILSISCAFAMWLAMILFPGVLSQLFTRDAELIRLTSMTMRIMFCTVVVLGLQMVNQNAFVAMGNSRYSFLFGIMRKLLLLVPLAFLLPHWFGVWGIYMAEAISNLLTTIVTHLVFNRYMNGLKERFIAA